MPTRYDLFATETPRRLDSGWTRRLVQIATLAYWTPLVALDLFLLRRALSAGAGYGFTFTLLFREAVVYLAAWLGIGAVHAILFSRDTGSSRPRLRRRRPARMRPWPRGKLSSRDPTRSRRGV